MGSSKIDDSLRDLQQLKNEELYWLVTYDKLIKTKKF